MVVVVVVHSAAVVAARLMPGVASVWPLHGVVAARMVVWVVGFCIIYQVSSLTQIVFSLPVHDWLPPWTKQREPKRRHSL